MDINRHRPRNINPFSIQLPLPALISIAHRLSGLFLFFCIPLLLWGLSLSLESQQHFENLKKAVNKPVFLVLLGISAAAFFFHLLAGIRHLLTDLNIGTSLKAARFTAWIVIILFISKITFIVLYFGGVQ